VVAASFVVVRVGVMAWGDPQWVRSSVYYRGAHVGYVTTTSYPDRDLTLFPEGSPYAEVAVSDLNEGHVALFQRFKEHWLIYCGASYATAAAGELSAEHVQQLAVSALRYHYQNQPGRVRTAALKVQIERLLT
jgi:hypothetical protein